MFDKTREGGGDSIQPRKVLIPFCLPKTEQERMKHKNNILFFLPLLLSIEGVHPERSLSNRFFFLRHLSQEKRYFESDLKMDKTGRTADQSTFSRFHFFHNL